ncbi:MAG: hypothetical protein BWY63_03813 [Chloroflexi bacterium ADurb.Bin360]|nr:MAG: hypothetical protein BWY63_03813 [Chloroflexi bacterium ADurb.Bin360]
MANPGLHLEERYLVGLAIRGTALIAEPTAGSRAIQRRACLGCLQPYFSLSRCNASRQHGVGLLGITLVGRSLNALARCQCDAEQGLRVIELPIGDARPDQGKEQRTAEIHPKQHEQRNGEEICRHRIEDIPPDRTRATDPIGMGFEIPIEGGCGVLLEAGLLCRFAELACRIDSLLLYSILKFTAE